MDGERERILFATELHAYQQFDDTEVRGDLKR